MNTKVYVDNLATVTTERELKELFTAYGNVMDVNIAVDHASHKPRGFGFVTMATPEGARAAIQALNGKAIGTCTLTASSPNGRQNPRAEPAFLTPLPLEDES